jgi:PHD/YefM family antitoxin component YafN of YafNO toxin-antitoxin module
MIKLKPEIIHQNGKPQFAVIPYADFLAIQDELEDTACLRLLRKAKASEGGATTLSLSDMKTRLGLGAKANRPKKRARLARAVA